MADPILDEQEIFRDLHTPVSSDNVARLQMAVVGAMCDIYDRKVTREQFCAMLGPCISMYGALAKLYVMNNLRASHKDGAINDDSINAAVDACENNVRSHASTVRAVMKQLMECPTSKDSVH